MGSGIRDTGLCLWALDTKITRPDPKANSMVACSLYSIIYGEVFFAVPGSWLSSLLLLLTILLKLMAFTLNLDTG